MIPISPARAGRRRPSREEVTRAVLDAAARLFARQGVDATSLDEVAAAAGFTKGAIYSNFGSKQALVDALVEDRTTAYLELGRAAVDGLVGRDDTRPLADRARALGDGLTAVARDLDDWHLLLMELWQRSARIPDPADTLRTQRRALATALDEGITEHAAAAGADLPLAAHDLALVVTALANGLALERVLDPDGVPDDLLGRVLALLVSGGTG